MSQQTPRTPAETPFNRACDACRVHKVRCLPNNSSASSKTCQRCFRTNRHCVFTAPVKRKQRKRTDTRVAELEREVQAMKALFDAKNEKIREQGGDESSNASKQWSGTPTKSNSYVNIKPAINESPRTGTSSGIPTSISSLSSPSSNNLQSQQALPLSMPLTDLDLDVIERGIVPMDLATELFNTYVKSLSQHYPAVVFPEGFTAEELRRTKPTLFLAVIAAASGKSDPSLYSILNSEVLSTFAHRIVMRSEKSLELVQAILITVIWYHHPGRFAQLKFYEYIHMAATMAMDIGLGTNPKTSRRRRDAEVDADSPLSDTSSVSEELDIERKRAFLACYLSTTGVSLSMRRPNMMRYNNWIDQCQETLTSSPSASPSDKSVVGWVKLLHISEEIAASFSFDDPGNMVDLSEPRAPLMLKGFEKRLEIWKKAFDFEIMDDDALLLTYYHTNIILHEVALHSEHPPEDFKPPFRLDKIILPAEIGASPPQIEAITVCISSTHSMFDVLLRMDIETLRSLPVFNYVRMTYAATILTKLYISSRTSYSQIGPLFDRESLKLDHYLKSLILRLNEAAGSMECRSPYTFLGLLLRLYSWFKKQESQDDFINPVELFGPDQALSLPVAEILMSMKNCDITPTLVLDARPPNSSQNQPQPAELQFRREEFQSNGVPEHHDTRKTNETQSRPETGSQFEAIQMQRDMDPFLLMADMDSFDGIDLSDWIPDIEIPGFMNDGLASEMCQWDMLDNQESFT